MSRSQTELRYEFDGELSDLISYHEGWKRFSSYASFSMTALSIVCAAAASVTAGLQLSVAAAILAALATVFTSLDKVLQFRERWDLHRVTADALSAVHRDMEIKGLAPAAGADEVNKILKHYNETMSTFRAHSGG